jgi:hypothetical protein
MTTHSLATFSTLSLLLVISPTFGTTIGGGAEIPMMLAIQEFCNAKHPEYRQANDAAFEHWKQRNRNAVDKARADPEYASYMEAARKLVAAMTADQNSQQTCSELAAKLSDPTLGGLYQPQYSAKAIEAWVVDGETNQPLEGVTVLANWQVEAGANEVYQIKILETVTDEKGRFYFPAWGPEPNPSATGYIGFSDPGLAFFKPGYRYLGQENIVLSQPRLGAVRYSDWDGKTIKMQKASSDADYLDKFAFLNRTLDSVLSNENEPCDWKRAPMTIAAVVKEERQLNERGLKANSSFESRLRANEQYFAMRECGSVNAFLDGLSK